MLSPELASELTAIVTVVLIDGVLAGDNAVVVGLAAGAPDHVLLPAKRFDPPPMEKGDHRCCASF